VDGLENCVSNIHSIQGFQRFFKISD